MTTKFNISVLTFEQLKELQSDITTLMDSVNRKESEAKLKLCLKQLADIKIGINSLLTQAADIVVKNPELGEFNINIGDYTHTYDPEYGWSSSYN